MSRCALEDEVRRLRAEVAARDRLTDVSRLDRATTSRRLAMLEIAIAAMPVGFMLFDHHDRLVFKNNRFQFYDSDGERDRDGSTLEDVLRFGLELGQYPEAEPDPEAWLAERLQAHAEPQERVLQPIRDGRVIQIEERRLADGSTVGTYTDVTELKRAEEALDRALKMAEQANETKSTFLARLSHELRVPLNAIVGFTEFLLSDPQGAVDETRRQQYLQDIQDASKHLIAIIADLLDISRVEAGRCEIEKEPVPLTSTCDQLGRLFEKQARDAGVRLTLSHGAGPEATVCADPRALRQMVINLLSNGIRHSRQDGAVELATRLDEGGVEIKVSDQGPGISAEELPKVTMPFYRSPHGTRRRSNGLGLGLALTRMLMDLHGGRLTLDSTEGVGTTATLRFPPAQRAPSSEALCS